MDLHTLAVGAGSKKNLKKIKLQPVVVSKVKSDRDFPGRGGILEGGSLCCSRRGCRGQEPRSSETGLASLCTKASGIACPWIFFVGND